MTHGFKNGRLIAELGTIESDGAGEMVKYQYGTTADHLQYFTSNGSPEGVHIADKGSTASDYTTGCQYYKTTDGVATGWVKVGSVTGLIEQNKIQNLGIAYSAGTFTITAADGTALSATNPGYVTLPIVATPGQLKTITITDNHQFVDDTGTSTLAGMLWGTDTAVNWTSEMPFFIYAIMKDDDSDVAFGITRGPANEISYASSNIGVRGAIVTTVENSFFLLDKSTGPTSPTVGDYDTNPSLLVGSFRMTKTGGAANDWTVSALDDRDGIERFNLSTTWNMPSGVNGSATGKYFQDTGATVPQFTNADPVKYIIHRNGIIFCIHEHNGITIAGAGAGLFEPTLPTHSLTGSDGIISFRTAVGTSTVYLANSTLNGTTNLLSNIKTSGSTTAWTSVLFNGASNYACNLNYRAFN